MVPTTVARWQALSDVRHHEHAGEPSTFTLRYVFELPFRLSFSLRPAVPWISTPAKLPLSPPVSVGGGKALGDGGGVWTRMQAAYDTWNAGRQKGMSHIPTICGKAA